MESVNDSPAPPPVGSTQTAALMAEFYRQCIAELLDTLHSIKSSKTHKAAVRTASAAINKHRQLRRKDSAFANSTYRGKR